MQRSPKPITKALPVPRDAAGELLLSFVAAVLLVTVVCLAVALLSPALHLVLT